MNGQENCWVTTCYTRMFEKYFDSRSQEIWCIRLWQTLIQKVLGKERCHGECVGMPKHPNRTGAVKCVYFYNFFIYFKSVSIPFSEIDNQEWMVRPCTFPPYCIRLFHNSSATIWLLAKFNIFVCPWNNLKIRSSGKTVLNATLIFLLKFQVNAPVFLEHFGIPHHLFPQDLLGYVHNNVVDQISWDLESMYFSNLLV